MHGVIPIAYLDVIKAIPSKLDKKSEKKIINEIRARYSMANDNIAEEDLLHDESGGED